MKKAILLAAAACAAAISAQAIVVSPITGPDFYALEGSDAFTVRAKDFGKSGDGDLYLGNGNLGLAANRVEANHNWQAVNSFSLTYDAVSGLVSAMVGATVLQDTFEAGLTINALALQIRDNDLNYGFALNNLVINGQAYGNIGTVPNGDTFVSVSDLPAGSFSISGDLVIDTGYSKKGENAKIELKAFGEKSSAAVPDSGATLAMLGLAVLGLAGARKRFSK